MLKSWTCMALNFHHTSCYQPVQALASGSGPKTADTVTVSQSFASSISQLSENALTILNQTFLAFCSKHVLPLRIKPFRQERIYQASLLLRLVKRYYLSHNVASSKVQSTWPKPEGDGYATTPLGYTRSTNHSVQKPSHSTLVKTFLC